MDKLTILVTDDDRLWNHPVVDACSGWKLRDLEDAIEVILGVFSVYGRMP